MIKNEDQRYREIGDRIRKVREKADPSMSQEALAKLVGFESGTAISLIEKGARKVSIPHLEKIAEVLHTTTLYLLGEDRHITSERNRNIDFRFALRAENDLSNKDKEAILDFYDFIKKKSQNEPA